MTDPLSPGACVGVVGGGQLGRMLAHAAHQMGYRVAVLTGGEKDTPAGLAADVEIAASFDDEHARERFLDEADVVTWEFENVDPGLAALAVHRGVPVRPGGNVIAVAQDRQLEKAALEAAGVPVAAWRAVASAAELNVAIDQLGGSVVAKAARFGYDGKGQRRIDAAPGDGAAVAARVWEDLGEQRLVVEAFVDFASECSVIVARGADGVIVDHGVMANDHVAHILDTTVTPAPIPDDVADEARRLAHRVAEHLDVVGVLCVEMFVMPEGGAERVVVNEIAPRPHNSGHLTIEAAPASQFEQQLRAVCGLPLGDGTCRPAAMVQLLGDLWQVGEPDWTAALADPSVHLHLYGKTEPRPGRKMGHLTVVASPPMAALEQATAARSSLSGG